MSTRDRYTCEDAFRRLDDYLDGELAAADRHPSQRDVERPQQQREHEQQRPQLRVLVGRREVVRPRIHRRVELAAVRRRSERG